MVSGSTQVRYTLLYRSVSLILFAWLTTTAVYSKDRISGLVLSVFLLVVSPISKVTVLPVLVTTAREQRVLNAPLVAVTSVALLIFELVQLTKAKPSSRISTSFIFGIVPSGSSTSIWYLTCSPIATLLPVVLPSVVLIIFLVSFGGLTLTVAAVSDGFL